jgi:Glycosyltransferase family 92
MTGGAWSRFLDYAARARSKPAFDLEEREWKLELAGEVRAVLNADEDGAAGDWPVRLIEPLNRDRLPHLMATQPRVWLRDWAASDPESVRSALAGFADLSLDPVERFARFAAEAERSGLGSPSGPGESDEWAVVTLGSVFTFAFAPESLPLVRTGPFHRLARLLGETIDPGDGSAADLYRGILAFVDEARGRLEAAGVPIRDMIDVQSLFDICIAERSMWTEDPPAEWLQRAQRPVPEGAAYLSVCALFRNEAPYLREWIEFHRIVGVERFFLYENASDDDFLEALAPYVDEGTVVLHDWPVPGADQAEVFDDCLRRHRDDARWIGFIDLDEFLFSPTGETLNRILPEFERWPGVGVEWAMCSMPGGRRDSAELVIESNLYRDRYEQRLVKSIVDPQRTAGCENAHWFRFEYGLPVDENGWPLASWGTKSTSFARLRVNHYASRSVEEAEEKIARQRSGWGHLRRWRERDLRGELDLVHDDAIARWIPELRASLERTGAVR